MALFNLQRAVATVSPTPPGTASARAPAAAAVDKVTAEEEQAVYPEPFHFFAAAVLIVVGVVAGTAAFDHWATGITFKPPDGINTLALFYLIAQVIERAQEPFTPFISAPDPDPPESTNVKSVRKNERRARAELERAVAKAEKEPSEERSRAAANKKRIVDQIRANATVLLFGTSSMLAMLLTGYLKADLVRTVGVRGSVTWVNVALTGLTVGAGTKTLHDLISNLKEAKEKKQDPQGT